MFIANSCSKLQISHRGHRDHREKFQIEIKNPKQISMPITDDPNLLVWNLMHGIWNFFILF
jgi:hypothetical protein